MGHHPVTLFCVSEITLLNPTTKGGGKNVFSVSNPQSGDWEKDYFTIVIARVALNDLVEMV
jgi:hypothetical protein